MSTLVENPKDRCSGDEAHMICPFSDMLLLVFFLPDICMIVHNFKYYFCKKCNISLLNKIEIL